jgi:hypothetical protein
VQTIWDKTQVLLVTSWGMHLRTLWELKNPLGTHSETRKKTKQKIFLPTLPHSQKEKTGPSMNAC